MVSGLSEKDVGIGKNAVKTRTSTCYITNQNLISIFQ